MSKGIILYKSKYGATKKYADWLTEETGFDCIETSKANVQKIKEYDTIILGGGIYASGIAGLSFLRKNISELKDKNIIIFCVGASPYNEKAFNELRQHNLKDDLKDIPCFYFRGAWNESEMSLKDKMLCKMLKKVVSKKDPSDYEPWEKALMEAIGTSCDWTDKKYLKPLINKVKF